MKFFKKIGHWFGSQLARAKFLRAARIPLPSSPAGRDMVRAAMAGMILFGIAGAGLFGRSGFDAFKIGQSSAGATITVGWGQVWLTWAAAGMAAGVVFGALCSFLFNLKSHRGGARALLLVGIIGGILAGTSWGNAVARERVAHVRAQTSSSKPLTVGSKTLTLVNGNVRLSGSVDREFNFPLLGFMIVGGTVVGALAARGLAERNYGRQDDGGQRKPAGGSPAQQARR
jgi:hypothetical protein